MEKEYYKITDGGRIIQKDNAYFKGRELAQVNSDGAEDAIRYFSRLFADLDKYVNAYLRTVRDKEYNDELLDRLKQLRSEVASTKAIGDFETLINTIDVAIEQQGREADAGRKAEAGEGSRLEEKTPSGSNTVPEENNVTGDGAGDKTGETGKVEEAGKAAAGEEAGDEEEKVTSKEEETLESEVAEEAEEAGKVEEAGKAAAGEEKSESEEDTEGSSEDEQLDASRYPESLSGLVELARKSLELSRQMDWQYVQHELENIRFKWGELVESDETLVSETGYQELLDLRERAEKQFAERKAGWHEQKREKKKENLDKRAKLLDQLQNVIDKKKWQAIKEVNHLTNRWEEIKNLPNDKEAEEQEKKFQELLQEFNNKKVEFLVKKAEKEEENLVGKLAVLDKMNQVITSIGPETNNWERLDVDMEELSRQWKKIGHVPMEQSDEIWERFKSARDEYFRKKMQYNKAFREQTEKNIRKKTRLCEAAEALLEAEDMPVAVREINNLHKKWKKTGPVPKEKNDELWERFNTATRKFNELKSRNLDKIRRQEQENLKKKAELCEKAEALQDRTDWAEVSGEMDNLMKAWKEIGPVPRRKAGKIWKRLKRAMDTFYENRRQHYRAVREEQKKNYEKKKEIISELEKLAEHEDAGEAVRQAKEFQEQFKQIGFVPLKKKSKIENDYKKACDLIYQRARNEGKHTGVAGSDKKTKAGSDKALRAEFFKLKKECDKYQEEILRYQDTKTFINPGGKGNALIDEIQQKIDEAEKKLKKKQDKLEELRKKLDS